MTFSITESTVNIYVNDTTSLEQHFEGERLEYNPSQYQQLADINLDDIDEVKYILHLTTREVQIIKAIVGNVSPPRDTDIQDLILKLYSMAPEIKIVDKPEQTMWFKA